MAQAFATLKMKLKGRLLHALWVIAIRFVGMPLEAELAVLSFHTVSLDLSCDNYHKVRKDYPITIQT